MHRTRSKWSTQFLPSGPSQANGCAQLRDRQGQCFWLASRFDPLRERFVPLTPHRIRHFSPQTVRVLPPNLQKFRPKPTPSLPIRAPSILISVPSIPNRAPFPPSTACRPARERPAKGPTFIFTQIRVGYRMPRGRRRERGRRSLEVDALIRGRWRYPLACMTTRPPSSTSTYRLWASSSNIPARGVGPTASASTYLGWPFQSAVTP